MKRPNAIATSQNLNKLLSTNATERNKIAQCEQAKREKQRAPRAKITVWAKRKKLLMNKMQT